MSSADIYRPFCGEARSFRRFSPPFLFFFLLILFRANVVHSSLFGPHGSRVVERLRCLNGKRDQREDS